MGFTACRVDAVYQRLQFIGAAAGDTRHVAFTGKTFGNSTTRCVSGAHYQYDFLVVRHGNSLGSMVEQEFRRNGEKGWVCSWNLMRAVRG